MAGVATISSDMVLLIATFLMLATLILAVNMRALARDPCTFSGLAHILAANMLLFFSSLMPAFGNIISERVSALGLVIAMHSVIVLGFLGILRGMGKKVSVVRILPASVVVIGMQIAAAQMYSSVHVHVLIAALGNGTLAAVFALLLARAVASFSRDLILLVVLPFATISILYLLRLIGILLALSDQFLMLGLLITGFVLTFSLLVWCFTLQTFGNVRLAQSLSAERERAQEASKMKSRFLANMSHEIRTPLNGVLGMAQVLDDKRLDADQREMVRIIQDSGETLLKLLDDILDLSKVEAGKLELEKVPFAPRDLIRRCAKLHGLRAQAQGIELNVDYGVGLDGIFLGDRHRLTQVLNNLLNNAIKFTQHGSVRIVADMIPRPPESGGGALEEWILEISVIDTGIGMQPKQLSRIFQDFTQADETISRQFGGTGLGLSITQKLLELMGGGVRVESRAGEGSAFHIWLPLTRWTERAADSGPAEPDDIAPETAVARAMEPAQAARGAGAAGTRATASVRRVHARPREMSCAPPLAGIRVLLAEDNRTNQRVVAAMLRETGVELVVVENGRSAVELDHAIATGAVADFDMFLFDVKMPEMDGPDAVSLIRQKRLAQGRPAPRSAVLTANALPEQFAEYRDAGFLDCLSKPIQKPGLIAVLHKLARPLSS
ncbi:MAG: response regulator [Roseinatronobacter sp.]|nr:response regulator [Roseinatronobacter sp.]